MRRRSTAFPPVAPAHGISSAAPLTLALMSFFFPRGKIEENLTFNRRDLFVRVLAFLRAPLAWVPYLALLIVYLGLYRGLASEARLVLVKVGSARRIVISVSPRHV